MNGFAANGIGRSSASARRGAQATAALLLSLTVPFDAVLAAWEEAPATSVASGTANPRRTVQLEVSASTLPRFDSADGANQANRIAFTWLAPPTHGFGPTLGMSLGMTSRVNPGSGVSAAYLRPQVDLGFHWRYTLDPKYRIDITAWHRVQPADAIDLVQSREPSYGARVEMGLASSMSKSGFVAGRGFVGLQLDGGGRITVRRSGGKPMVYYRTTF